MVVGATSKWLQVLSDILAASEAKGFAIFSVFTI